MVGRCVFALCFALGLAGDVDAGQELPAPSPAVRWQVRNTTRLETWRFFEPSVGGGEPDYAFLANRLLLGLDYRRPRIELGAAAQYVQFGGLPATAAGPGPLGTGALYFDHAGRTDSRQLYLRTLQLRLRNLSPGVDVQVGRFGYTSGAESPSGDSKIEAVKRMRLDSRLIGEFEWSLYQRTFDGIRLDVSRPRWHGSASVVRPTQGGFEERAGRPLNRVRLAALTFSVRPGPAFRHTDWQGFVYRYDDTRRVRARPDNSLLPAGAVDVGITSVGTSLVGAYPAAGGQFDTLGWAVWQNGDWYGQDHRAGAAAAELGYQRPNAPWRPWLRAGWFRSTGDADPGDGDHGTFFQVLPTARKYSLSTIYNLMNLTELFGQVLLRPRANVGLRLDAHRLRLTSASDLWYSGSGATQRSGTIFGFAGRRSNGSSGLGVIVEGSADWTLSPHFSVNGYLSRMNGGDVIGGTFAGRRLVFGYVETVVSF
jgi:hypothetical protein